MSLTDPMKFEELRDSIESLLASNQGSFFQVIGYQKQSGSAESVKTLSTVQIFYSSGEYHKAKSSYAKVTHEAVFSIHYTVALPAKGDLSILDDENATAAAKQTALLLVQKGGWLADRAIDELRRVVTQIILDPVNKDLGLNEYEVSNRWLSNFRKSTPIDKGNLVVLTATEDLSATIDETFTGATLTPAVIPVIDLTAEQKFIDNDSVDSPAVGIKTEQ